MKKSWVLIFVALFLFLQSCNSNPEEVALKCSSPSVAGVKTLKAPNDYTFTILINYKDSSIKYYDDQTITPMLNMEILPEVISYELPDYRDSSKTSPDVSRVYINRRDLSFKTEFFTPTGAVPVMGTCKKISLPNFSSFGKKI